MIIRQTDQSSPEGLALGLHPNGCRLPRPRPTGGGHLRRLSPSASWERATPHSSKPRGQAADALACSARRPSREPLRGPPGRHGRVPAVASAASRGRKARTADGNGARPVEMGSKPRQTQPRARTPRSAPLRKLSSSPFPVLGLRCECPPPPPRQQLHLCFVSGC